ncbi:hypothetical protein IMY05_C4788000100 [Salix suchowensis]|nr:hypothetical protein IMY05_C4788000100 [Salix suchowensis]
MRVRRVNHLFYAVALDHRFRTLSILDEQSTMMRVARFPQFARRIQNISLCMQHLKALQTYYALIMANQTKTNDADPGAFGSERDFGEEFMDCICHVFAHAITLSEVRLILPNTPVDDEEFELESLQDLWYRVPRPHDLTSLTLQLDVTKLGLLLDLAPNCISVLSATSAVSSVTGRIHRIHVLFREVGPTLEKLTFCSTIKHLTARRSAMTAGHRHHARRPEPVHAINNNYPALTVLLMHGGQRTLWSGTFDAPRLEKLYLSNCFQRSSTPDDVNPKLDLLEIEVREIDVFLMKCLKAAFPNVRRLGIMALPLRGEVRVFAFLLRGLGNTNFFWFFNLDTPKECIRPAGEIHPGVEYEHAI